jgi:hypothetical protein
VAGLGGRVGHGGVALPMAGAMGPVGHQGQERVQAGRVEMAAAPGLQVSQGAAPAAAEGTGWSP